MIFQGIIQKYQSTVDGALRINILLDEQSGIEVIGQLAEILRGQRNLKLSSEKLGKITATLEAYKSIMGGVSLTFDIVQINILDIINKIAELEMGKEKLEFSIDVLDEAGYVPKWTPAQRNKLFKLFEQYGEEKEMSPDEVKDMVKARLKDEGKIKISLSELTKDGATETIDWLEESLSPEREENENEKN